jgi:hypothetical protein
MATEPVGDGTASSVRPSGPAELRRLRAERDALEARALEAELRAEELAGELAELRAEQAVDPERLSLFDDLPPDDTPGRAERGSDPAVVTLALGGTAVITGVVALYAAFDRGLFSPVALLLLAVTFLLGYLAWNSKEQTFEISVGRGMVYIDSSSDSYRFDLRSSTTKLEMIGQPGDPGWELRFLRRHLDPFTVDATMVDPVEFVRQVREWRPEL